MTLVDYSSASSAGAVRYFVFIVCICLFLFFFLVVRLASGLAPEIYQEETPVKPVYRAQHADPPVQVSEPARLAAPWS
ncbi:MAG: hypothetical protein SH809_02220 [Rhodothermales bacterium]|nr:hypothetical protein [Rhodothermales bacterium]